VTHVGTHGRAPGWYFLFWTSGRGLRFLMLAFEDYCRDRWDFHRRHAYRLIDSASVVKQLECVQSDTKPANESQVRPSPNLKQQKHKETHGICSFFTLISTTKKKSLIFLGSFFIVGLGRKCLMELSNTNVNSKHSSF